MDDGKSAIFEYKLKNIKVSKVYSLERKFYGE